MDVGRTHTHMHRVNTHLYTMHLTVYSSLEENVAHHMSLRQVGALHEQVVTAELNTIHESVPKKRPFHFTPFSQAVHRMVDLSIPRAPSHHDTPVHEACTVHNARVYISCFCSLDIL